MKRNLIIDGRQKQGKRIFEYFFTLAGWGYVVLFSIQVILSLLLWTVGIHYIRHFIISEEYYTLTVRLVFFTIACAIVVLSIAMYWSYYNKFRYGKLRRRTMPTDVTVAELSEIFSVPEEFVQEIQTKRWIELDGELEVLHEVMKRKTQAAVTTRVSVK